MGPRVSRVTSEVTFWSVCMNLTNWVKETEDPRKLLYDKMDDDSPVTTYWTQNLENDLFWMER